ncbi:MAG TPA: epoxide hydrolase N-terminal domain-containing protein, partial [Longimicrobium sp.]|nr:epoxide hydrolase N-terminal domain-containing protein [Longimicrobium sp.]
MTLAKARHGMTAAGALGLLLLAAPGGAQVVAASTRAPAAAPRVVYTGPISATAGPGAETTAIRPFRVRIPDAALTALRQRLRATRWPDRETVSDRSQGVQLAALEELVRYWATDYDWRKAEAR